MERMHIIERDKSDRALLSHSVGKSLFWINVTDDNPFAADCTEGTRRELELVDAEDAYERALSASQPVEDDIKREMVDLKREMAGSKRDNVEDTEDQVRERLIHMLEQVLDKQ